MSLLWCEKVSKQRLTRNEVKTVFSQGKRYFGELFTLLYLPASSFGCSIVVSKKGITAVQRNYFKRRFRALVTKHALATSVSGHFIVLVKSPKQLAATLDLVAITQKIEQDLTTIAKKISAAP